MGRAVRVHPLAVILGIGAGILVAGIPGALFAVPVIAVTNVVVSYLARGEDTSPDGVLSGGAGAISWPLPGTRIWHRPVVGDAGAEPEPTGRPGPSIGTGPVEESEDVAQERRPE
jgi:hypothetical protein